MLMFSFSILVGLMATSLKEKGFRGFGSKNALIGEESFTAIFCKLGI